MPVKSIDDNIKRLWQMHTEAQEQILRSHALPISIIPAPVTETNGKVVLTADESNKTDLLLEHMSESFGIDAAELSNSDGFFFVDKGRVPSLEIRKSLSSEAEHCHIKFRPLPVIDGLITSNDESLKSFTSVLLNSEYDYSFDRKGRLQIAISDLVDLKTKVSSNSNLNISIPEKASAIFQLQPSPLFFLKKEYPSIDWIHKTRVFVNPENNTLRFSRTIELVDGFLNRGFLEELEAKYGMRLSEYTLAYSVDDEARHAFSPKPGYTMPKFDKKENAYVIRIAIKERQKERNTEDAIFEDPLDVNYTHTFYLRLFERLFGKGNVSLKSSHFYYRYDTEDFYENFIAKNDEWKNEFWDSVYETFSQSEISVSLQSESIGLDFNWKEDSMRDIMADLCERIPYALISYYTNHRCNLDLQVQDTSLDTADATLRENFPSIQIIRNDWTGDLVFFQEYSDVYQHDRIYNSLKRQIEELDLSDYSITLSEIPSGKEKFIFKIDKNSQVESQIEIIQTMRGKDFVLFDGTKLGRLIRISYPLLTFVLDDTDKEQATRLLEEGMVNRVFPDITGDLEKIYRLKKAFSSIVKGENLKNENLSNFIFDASKAKPIENVDYYIDERSDFYQEITAHLLDKRIVDSQKKAIIKALKAEDLAVIQGPPGTGKSTAIAEIIWQHIRLNPRERILLTSETNLAVDNAIDRIVNNTHNLVKPIRIGDDSRLVSEGRQFSLEAMRSWVENGFVLAPKRGYHEDDADSADSGVCQKIILDNWIDNILRRVSIPELGDDAAKRWSHFLASPDRATREIIFNQYIKHCNVIGATCSSIGERSTKGAPTGFFRYYCQLFGKVDERTNREGRTVKSFTGKISFDTVIQDESSKATPAELSLPLIYGKKNIIIGDHRQLPPLLAQDEFISSLDYLQRELEDPRERQKIQRLKSYVENNFDEMEISHFQRLIEAIDPSLKGVFNKQYRMHWAINDAIAQFYEEDGGLTCGLDKASAEDPNIGNPSSRYHGLDIEGLVRPTDHIIWLDTDSPELEDGTSRVNYGEVDVVRAVLNEFRDSDSFRNYMSLWKSEEEKQIGLISFYGKQIKQLWRLGKEYPTIPLEINTVDRFQGMERNIIIVSMVRSSCIAADKEQRPDYDLYGPLGFPPQYDMGFAKSPNRLNVALSRAKRLLIIIGNSSLFRRKGIYDKVYRIIDESECGNIIKCDAEWIGKRL